MARQCRWFSPDSKSAKLCSLPRNLSVYEVVCPYATIRKRIWCCKNYLPRPVYRASQEKIRG